MTQKYGKKYITLSGDPLDHAHPVSAPFYNGDVNVMGAAGAFNAAMSGLDGQTIPELFITTTSPVLMFLMSKYMFERSHIFSAIGLRAKAADEFSVEEYDTLCIDTDPSATLCAKSVSKYYSKSMKQRSDHQKALGILALSFSGTIMVYADSSLEAVQAVSSLAVAGKRLSSGYRRFNKVAKGEWAIVDRPDPLEIEERQSLSAPQFG